MSIVTPYSTVMATMNFKDIHTTNRRKNLTKEEKALLATVVQIKPQWTQDEVYTFIEKNDWNHEKVSASLAKHFDEVRPEQDEWRAINTKYNKQEKHARSSKRGGAESDI
uniref:Tripartite motif containing 13 n=1 Tax=Lygus hesperus TaxID=30085 RepID=A0A0A9W8K5_LYGHE